MSDYDRLLAGIRDEPGCDTRRGAAYIGQDGLWRNVPMGMMPFDSEADAEAFVERQREPSRAATAGGGG